MNPDRDAAFFERPTGLSARDRSPCAGSLVETARETAAQAAACRDDADRPDYAQDCFALLTWLVAYLEALPGPGGFRQVLTPAERISVGECVSRLLAQPPQTP